MTTAVQHNTCPDAQTAAAEVERVIDRMARAYTEVPEQACATPGELAALGEVTAWIATPGGEGGARKRLHLLVLSALERAGRAYGNHDDATVEPRTGAPEQAQRAASTVAALLTIRVATGDPAALHSALATIVEHAGPDDLWALLIETARTWGHILAATTRATG